jgi:monovalent cation:H+ antiporter, CPA1 family
MHLFHVLTILIVLAALFAYLNYRYIRLPTTIGIMMLALVVSLALVGLGELGFEQVIRPAERMLHQINFGEALMQGMLAFLLFAGALHIDLEDLRPQKGVVAALSVVGTGVSTAIVGALAYGVLKLLGFDVALLWCMVFGALISPTDPIAVMGILKTTRAPKSLETKIAGESLFNDGIGVVVFLVLLEVATGARELGAGRVAFLFAQEAVGGVLLGLLVGVLGYAMLKRVDNYQVEVLLTLAIAMGAYALADALHRLHWAQPSGPLAVVAAGLLIGNQGRAFAMSERTRANLDTFWELVDEILNATLFLMIGLELLVLPLVPRYFVAGLLMIPVVLLARFLSVSATIRAMQFRRSFTPGAIRILTWSGLRGGISVALALALPGGEYQPERRLLLVMTYTVVVFSIIVQGLTVGPLVRRTLARYGSEVAVAGPETITAP